MLVATSIQIGNTKSLENENSLWSYLNVQIYFGLCEVRGYVHRFDDKGDWAYQAYAALDGMMAPFACAGLTLQTNNYNTKVINVTRTPNLHTVDARYTGQLIMATGTIILNSWPINEYKTFWFLP